MAHLFRLSKRLVDEESGATLVEYGLLIGLVAIVAFASVLLLGQYVNGAFHKLQSGVAADG